MVSDSWLCLTSLNVRSRPLNKNPIFYIQISQPFQPWLFTKVPNGRLHKRVVRITHRINFLKLSNSEFNCALYWGGG